MVPNVTREAYGCSQMSEMLMWLLFLLWKVRPLAFEGWRFLAHANAFELISSSTFRQTVILTFSERHTIQQYNACKTQQHLQQKKCRRTRSMYGLL